MKKTPTAKQFIKNCGVITENDLIEFAFIHVRAALEKACQGAEVEDIGDFGENGDEPMHYYAVNHESIRNSYPKENIL